MIISSCFIEMDGRVFALLRFSLLVFFVEANSPLDGQVAMSTCPCPIVILPMLSPPCYPPHVIPLMDHCFQTRTIVIKPQVEAPSNYSLFHPPVQKDKTMEVPLSSTYLYEKHFHNLFQSALLLALQSV